ncbi:MAG: JAB domain-containing protein [Nitrospiraceae bacterium]
MHPREVFKPAILLNACAIIAVHNHPSGDPTPSVEDRTLTTRLREAGVAGHPGCSAVSFSVTTVSMVADQGWRCGGSGSDLLATRRWSFRRRLSAARSWAALLVGERDSWWVRVKVLRTAPTGCDARRHLSTKP